MKSVLRMSFVCREKYRKFEIEFQLFRIVVVVICSIR